MVEKRLELNRVTIEVHRTGRRQKDQDRKKESKKIQRKKAREQREYV